MGAGLQGLRARDAGRGVRPASPASPGGVLGPGESSDSSVGTARPARDGLAAAGWEEAAGRWESSRGVGPALGIRPRNGGVRGGGQLLARALGRGWLSGRGRGISHGPPCEEGGEHLEGVSAALGVGRAATVEGTVSAVRVPALSGCAKPGCLQVSHLCSVEPPGAEIRMFRFMRDVEPEDPMFLM